MLYVLASADGALLAWNAVEAELPMPPAISVVRALDEWDAPPPSPYEWTPSAVNWTIPAPLVKSLSKLEFSSRFSLAEQVALDRAQSEHPDPNVRSSLRVIEKSLDRVTEKAGVDVSDPRTILGATTCVDVLVSLGLVTAQNRDARLAAVLAPP